MSDDQLVDVWRQIIVGAEKSWVLFKHGTCVILMQPEADLTVQATTILKEWGPVQVGSPAGDFSVIALQDMPGWVITSHHPDVLTYVSPHEFEDSEEPAEVMVGLLGRARRGEDAQDLEIIHVEDKRRK